MYRHILGYLEIETTLMYKLYELYELYELYTLYAVYGLYQLKNAIYRSLFALSHAKNS